MWVTFFFNYFRFLPLCCYTTNILQVVEHMSERMTLLPHDMQYGLKLCACLGNKFDAVVLQKSISENDINLNDFFTMAVEVRL